MIKLYIVVIIFIASIGNAVFSQQSEFSSDLKLRLNDKKINDKLSLSEKRKLKENKIINDLKLNYSLSGKKKNLFTVSSVVNPDDIGKKYPIWVPIAELVGMHTAVCLFSNHVLENDFAKISFKSVEQNFKTGFVWDPDYFVTNFFAHPYNGSLYYNLARSNGYNYAVSSIFAFSGSLTWELFMETEPPAYNDLMTTTISGIFLGEVTHRLSSLLIDDRKTGFERVMREIGIAAIDLSRGFNRLFQGKSWATNKNTYKREPLALNAYYGVNWNNYGTKIGTGVANGVAGFGLLYGDPFKQKKREIMDFFRLAGYFNFGAGQPAVGGLEGFGLLYGKSRKTSPKNDELFGIFHHYDYFENEAYQIGTITFSGGWFDRYRTSKNSQLLTSIKVGIMPLGGSKSTYIDTVERTYSFSGGANTRLEIAYDAKWGFVNVGYNFYWFHTYVGALGNEFYGLFRPKISVYISKNVSIGALLLFGHKEGYYNEHPDVKGRVYQAMLLLQYKFGNITF